MTLAAVVGGAGIPPEPDWTAVYTDVIDLGVAREEWGVVCRELNEAGTLTVANGHAVKRLVEFRVIYERASREIAESGALIRAKRTRVPQINPNWSIMRQAAEQVASIEAELCLSPRRRATAGKVQRRAKVDRPSDAYLKPVAK